MMGSTVRYLGIGSTTSKSSTRAQLVRSACYSGRNGGHPASLVQGQTRSSRFCDTVAVHLRNPPGSRRYLSSAQGQIRRQNQLESGQLPKPSLGVKLIDCIETASNPTQ